MRAFPGPAHYAGDVLTFEVPLDSFVEPAQIEASLTVDGATRQVRAVLQYNYLLLRDVLDTRGMSGEKTARIQAQHEGLAVDASYSFTVQPASERPVQETGLAWESERIACCQLHYLTHTAAARDIAYLAELAQRSAEEVSELTGVDLDGSMDIYFFDRMWMNGAFGGGGELVVVYTDRGYGPAQGAAGLSTLFRHELTHATGVDYSETLNSYFRYNEGLAVYLTGGHYKPEPLQQRGAAMAALGFDGNVDGGPFITNHELAYLHAATVVAFVVDEYGWDKLWEFREVAVFETFFDETQMDEVVVEVFGAGLTDFQQSYWNWLNAVEPGAQVEDLQLTIDLQALRREYQRRFSPQPEFVFGTSDVYAQASIAPSLVREANSPAHQAIELMIQGGQRAIVAGRYAEAQLLVDAVGHTLETGLFTHPLASYYASVVEALTAAGYETVELDFEGASARAAVLTGELELAEIPLELTGGVWQIVE